MAEQYNSAYTGAEIDAAIAAVTQKEASWDDGVTKANAALPKSVYVLLNPEGWLYNETNARMEQTVTVGGVLADESQQLIIPTPFLSYQDKYITAGIICCGQAENSLTFAVTSKPTNEAPPLMEIFVTIQEVSTG